MCIRDSYYPNYAADPTHFLSLEGQYISRHGGRADPTAYASIPELFHWLPDNEEDFHVAFATSPYAFIMSLTPLVSLITVSRHGSIVQILPPHNLTCGYVRQSRAFASESPLTQSASRPRNQCYPPTRTRLTRTHLDPGIQTTLRLHKATRT